MHRSVRLEYNFLFVCQTEFVVFIIHLLTKATFCQLYRVKKIYKDNKANLVHSGLPAVAGAERCSERTDWLCGLRLHCCGRASVVSYLNSCNERGEAGRGQVGGGFLPSCREAVELNV